MFGLVVVSVASFCHGEHPSKSVVVSSEFLKFLAIPICVEGLGSSLMGRKEESVVLMGKQMNSCCTQN